VTIPEVTSEARGRRGRGGGRSGRRGRGRGRKNEIPGIETGTNRARSKTNLRQAIERHHAAEAETTTTSGHVPRLPPLLPVPTGNERPAAPPGDDDENDNEDDREASGNEASDNE